MCVCEESRRENASNVTSIVESGIDEEEEGKGEVEIARRVGNRPAIMLTREDLMMKITERPAQRILGSSYLDRDIGDRELAGSRRECSDRHSMPIINCCPEKIKIKKTIGRQAG